jgi:hypothetical protein
MSRSKTIYVTIISIFLFAMILQLNKCIAAKPQTRLPSPLEIQQYLKDKGYYSGIVDGVIGQDTNAAWHKAMYDQERKKIQKRMIEAANR